MTPTSTPLLDEIAALEQRIRADKERLAALRKQASSLTVTQDYAFTAPDGTTRKLSELFGDRDELIVVHNMGIRCSYCAMWADGFNGMVAHLQDRAAFVVASPDAPAVQAKVKADRGWRFELVSHAGTSFSQDMGFLGTGSDDGAAGEAAEWPGASGFKKHPDGTITRTAKAFFGPGDDFCAAWHLFELLPEGANGWQPQLAYRTR